MGVQGSAAKPHRPGSQTGRWLLLVPGGRGDRFPKAALTRLDWRGW